jgi:hypothetical protein
MFLFFHEDPKSDAIFDCRKNIFIVEKLTLAIAQSTRFHFQIDPYRNGVHSATTI